METTSFSGREEIQLADPPPETAPGEVAAHVFDPRSVAAVKTALASGRPLLVRGEPGIGKTQLARAVAQELKRVLVSYTVDARTEAQDLRYEFDALARLAKAQVLGALQRGEDVVKAEMQPCRFVAPSALWWAFDWESAWEQRDRATEVQVAVPVEREAFAGSAGVVALIDEIDKADSSVPNGLLQALGEGRFLVPAGCGPAGETAVVAQRKPLIIATTNEERALPDAFLRRCVVLQLALPEEDEAFVKVLMRRGRAHFKQLDEAVLIEAARQLLRDRREMQHRQLSAPGQAEYLDLLRAVSTLSQGSGRSALDWLEEIREFVFVKHPQEQGGL